MFRKLAVLTAGVALLGFGLGAAPASAQTAASITVKKTVTTEPGVCGTASSIQVAAGTTVYYCYTVTNTGNAQLNAHTLDDDQLGNIFTDLDYTLVAGKSVDTVAASLPPIKAVITETTTNVGTWKACTYTFTNGTGAVPQGIPACDTATATAVVTVAAAPTTIETAPTVTAAAPAVAAAGSPRFTG